MNPILIYSNTMNGELIQTGNTLGLATDNARLSQGIFTVASPLGTTSDWRNCSSSAILTLLPNSTVKFAELVWSGGYKNASSDITADINTPIRLMDPKGITHTIQPNLATALTSTAEFGPILSQYSQSVDITSIVAQAGSGTYTIGGVPGILSPGPAFSLTDLGGHSGWQIIVVVEAPSLPMRNINIWYTNSMLAGSFTGNSLDIPITGFATPPSGPVKSRIIMGASNGNSNPQFGDNLLLGASESSLVTLTGPNNPLNNFYCSQINNNQGLLDTTGTFGNKNAVVGEAALPGDRISWDVTNIDASPALVNNQTSGLIRVETNFELLVINNIAIQIDVFSANISPVIKSVDKTTALIGDTLTYTITFTNTGDINADNVVITDIIPSGTSYIPSSVTVNRPFSGIPATGITLTTPLQPTQNVIVSFKVKIDKLISINPIKNTATVDYQFTSLAGQAPVSVENSSNTVITTVTCEAPVINANDKCLLLGTAFNPLTGVTATNCAGADITSKIIVTSNTVNTAVAGVYSVTYSVTDPLGKTSTKTISVTVCAPTARQQAITDVFESVALEQAALSHILNAEGEKIQKAVALGLTISELIEINKSVTSMANAITMLEHVLANKIDLFQCDICGNGQCCNK